MNTLLVDLLFKVVTSDFAKELIKRGVDYLLNHDIDGITSDVSHKMLDGIAKSEANDVPADAFEFTKREYLK
jgi:hypothetical protein